jgi:hypothetical protein
MFNRSRASNDPRLVNDVGDALLLREGYTLVWLGWQHDAPPTPGISRIRSLRPDQSGFPYAATSTGSDSIAPQRLETAGSEPDSAVEAGSRCNGL